jgi:hypothetical protein
MAYKRRRKPGDLSQLRAVLWRLIVEVEDLLDARPPSNELVLKCAHAMAQLAGAYKSVLEVVSLDARLTAVEQRFTESPNGKVH